MKVHFLGTAAAEGWPALFCRCEHCRKARELGGKNIRTRTSVLVDDILKIDLPPDTYYHVLRDGLDLAAVEDLLITHTHMDHLNPYELEMRLPIFAHGCEHPLTVHGHDLAIQRCREAAGPGGDRLAYHLIQPFRAFDTGTARITPLLADHDRNETCLLFYIEKDGKTLLYAHDTGWFPEETWEWLKGKRIDLLIIDSTNGNINVRRNHLNIEAVVEIKGILEETGSLHKDSTVVATHFSHNTGLLHEDLNAIYEPHGIVTAYDGMVLCV